jgi:hypothetical protein
LQGFYAVYRVVFDLLAEEDYEFIEDKGDKQEIPGFGKSDSPYDTVQFSCCFFINRYYIHAYFNIQILG